MVCTVNTDNSPGLVRRFGVMAFRPSLSCGAAVSSAAKPARSAPVNCAKRPSRRPSAIKQAGGRRPFVKLNFFVETCAAAADLLLFCRRLPNPFNQIFVGCEGLKANRAAEAEFSGRKAGLRAGLEFPAVGIP